MDIKLHTDWYQYLKRPESEWSLVQFALLAANHLQPDMDYRRCLSSLNDMAGELAQTVKLTDDLATRIERLNAFFYTAAGFGQNTEDYYHPDNSLLNRVLETRQGIPITLSILYMHFAQGIDLPVFGISFPGHFLVGINTAEGPWILDIFNRAERLDKKKLFELLAKSNPSIERVSDIDDFLVPAPKHLIMVRLLRNIKNIYIEKQQAELALIVIQLIFSLVPETADELRDRGMIYHHLDYAPGAIHDLKRYLDLQPESPERPVVEALLESLAQKTTHLH
jgi:regulator of sirC expression with transglutaminase-like and TPR domain